jgi:hypothetical protein
MSSDVAVRDGEGKEENGGGKKGKAWVKDEDRTKRIRVEIWMEKCRLAEALGFPELGEGEREQLEGEIKKKMERGREESGSLDV